MDETTEVVGEAVEVQEDEGVLDWGRSTEDGTAWDDAEAW